MPAMCCAGWVFPPLLPFPIPRPSDGFGVKARFDSRNELVWHMHVSGPWRWVQQHSILRIFAIDVFFSIVLFLFYFELCLHCLVYFWYIFFSVFVKVNPKSHASYWNLGMKVTKVLVCGLVPRLQWAGRQVRQCPPMVFERLVLHCPTSMTAARRISRTRSCSRSFSSDWLNRCVNIMCLSLMAKESDEGRSKMEKERRMHCCNQNNRRRDTKLSVVVCEASW